MYQLFAVIAEVGVFLGGPHNPPFVLRSTTLCTVVCSLAALKGISHPSIISVDTSLWAGAFCIEVVDQLAFHSDMWVTYPFHSPHFIYLALPAMTQFSEW